MARKLLALFAPEHGFEPHSFAAFAYGDDDALENLRRSFRFELNGCCTHLTIEAPRASRWRQQLARRLAQAGYEPWLSGKDSVDVRRWLSTAPDRLRELGFIKELGSTGQAARWPRRTATARPALVPHGRWSRELWERVIEKTYQSGIAWNDGSLCFSRMSKREGPTESGILTINTGLVPWWDTRRKGKALMVYATVSEGRSLLPPRVARTFRRRLLDAGFERDRVRSVRDGKLQRGRVGFERMFSTESRAVQACVDIHNALLEAPLAGAGKGTALTRCNPMAARTRPS